MKSTSLRITAALAALAAFPAGSTAAETVTVKRFSEEEPWSAPKRWKDFVGYQTQTNPSHRPRPTFGHRTYKATTRRSAW